MLFYSRMLTQSTLSPASALVQDQSLKGTDGTLVNISLDGGHLCVSV
jgi:hypothetical protein